jgi:guanosine-3',5'-bis(diphosphate) 3'-pyrophosphohydrolase
VIDHPSQISLDRLEQHFKTLSHAVRELACYNPVRVQENFSQLIEAMKTVYKAGEGWIEEDVHQMMDAIHFAAEKHQTQIRKDQFQTSYLNHLLSVAHQLIVVGKVRNHEIIMASLLHDTLEDTPTSYQELISHFGKRVADFVQEVTDEKNLTKEERKRRQIESAPHKSSGAAQIKLADKWDNLHDLLESRPLDWSEERIQAYFDWAEEVIQRLPWVNASLLRATQEVIKEYDKKK